MSLLKPFTPEEILDAVATGKDDTSVEGLSAKEIFSAQGADIQAAARAAVLIMNSAEKEADRLRAAELVLKVQGVYTPDQDKKTPPGIVINIISQSGAEQSNLINLVMPTV